MPPPALMLTHRLSGVTVARVTRLDGWWAKGVGVIGMPALPPGVGVWLPGVAAVHTLFVRFPMDLLFLDDHFHAILMLPSFPAWRPLARAPQARHTIELGAETFAAWYPALSLHPGDIWDLHPTL